MISSSRPGRRPNIGSRELERVLKMVSCGIREASDHETNHANANHRFAMIQTHFIVAAQAPRFVEPAEGSFYNPAFGQDLKAFGAITPPHDFQFASSRIIVGRG